MARQYIEGFPQTQQEMADWQRKYKFDQEAGKWYDPVVETPPTAPPPTTPPTEPPPTTPPPTTPPPTAPPAGEQPPAGRTELPFPQTQEEMATYQQKKASGEYVFEGGKWYRTGAAPPTPPGAAPPSPEAPPEAPPTPEAPIPPTPQEQALMDKHGYTIEQLKDPSFITNEVNRITGEIGTLQPGLEREEKIRQMVELFASLGFDYPKEAIEALTGPPDETEEEIRKTLYEKYGIEDLEAKFKDRPEQTFEEIYSSAYDDLKLAELKAEIDEFRKKIAEAEEARDKRIADINENPWLTEASRVGRVKRESDRAEKELLRLTNQMTLADTMYSRGKEEATNLATRALETFAKERKWEKEELAYYIDRAEAELEAKMKEREAEAGREVYRYFPEYAEAFKKEDKGKEFTAQEQRRLEQAGLADASRKEQLDYLYEKEGVAREEITVGSIFGLDKTTANRFDNDLEQEIKAVYSGKYGTEGAREMALRNLQAKYPGIAEKIAEVIYGSERFNAAFPDGYEADIQGREEDEQFITKDWLISSFGEDALIQTAKDEGYGELFRGGRAEMNKYLDDLMKRIEAWRKAGKSDDEIIKMMQ